jgi:hypothetical protein
VRGVAPDEIRRNSSKLFEKPLTRLTITSSLLIFGVARHRGYQVRIVTQPNSRASAAQIGQAGERVALSLGENNKRNEIAAATIFVAILFPTCCGLARAHTPASKVWPPPSGYVEIQGSDAKQFLIGNSLAEGAWTAGEKPGDEVDFFSDNRTVYAGRPSYKGACQIYR